jgi:hypothetical protein
MRIRHFRHTCPYCGSQDICRARRRTLYDFTLALFCLRPYRCGRCDRRHFCMRRAQELGMNSPVLPKHAK